MQELINKNTLGNCFDVLPKIHDNSIDLIITDLPYQVTQNPNDIALPLDRLWDQFTRIAKETTAFIFTSQFPYSVDLIASKRNWFKYDLIWDKVLVTGHLNAARMPMRQHEHILVFYKKQPTYNPQCTEGKPRHSEGNSLGKKPIINNYGNWKRLEDEKKGETKKMPTSIVTFQKPHPSKSLHPTQKPIELFEWLIRTYSNENDLVLDPCVGSGTTSVACMNTKRQFIGIDILKCNIDIANNRLEQPIKN